MIVLEWIAGAALLSYAVFSALEFARAKRKRDREDRIFAANMRAYFREHPE